MKKIGSTILFLALAMATNTLSAQNDTTKSEYISKYISTAMMFNQVFPQEKVYLHFDNNGYYIGERMWFKAYVTRSCKTSENKSKVLYVELVDPSGNTVETQKLEIQKGQANGDIQLDKLLTSGFYEVRAYTKYMTNWGKDVIFSRVFPIFRKPSADGNYSQHVIDEISYRKRLPDYREKDTMNNEKINVHFYPEGGKMIKGLKCKVAFDVTNNEGAHMETNGYLLCGGDTITAVKTMREGRGIFSFTPTDKQVALVLHDSKGKLITFTIPEAANEGCELSVNTLPSYEIITEINATRKLFGKQIGMVIIHNGNIIKSDSMILNGHTITKIFKKSDLKEGVNQITLFDTEGQILADRMVFIYPHNKIANIRISSSPNAQLKPCKKAELTAETIPNTTFSLAIRDADTQTNGNNNDAATWLLLSSDLKGYIENPYYYLESDNEEHNRAADLLMMVQGWRRYDFKRMEGRGSFDKFQPAEDNLYVMGKLHKVKKADEVGNVDIKLILYNKDGQSLVGETKTSQHGFYAFKILKCFGDWNMQIFTKKQNKSHNYYVGIDRHFSPSKRNISFYETQPLPVDSQVISFNTSRDDGVSWPMEHDNYLLKEIKVKGHYLYNNAKNVWQEEARGAWKSSIYYDCDKEADEIADRGEDTPGFMEWLEERNKYLEGTVTNMNEPIYSKRNGYTSYDLGDLSYKHRPIIWVVNNLFYTGTFFPVQYSGILTSNDTGYAGEPFPTFLEDAKSVFISEDDNIWMRYIWAQSLSSCHPVTIFVYTHDYLPAKEKGMRRTHFEGYNVATEFENTVNNYRLIAPQPDYRRTLYWNPNVTTDNEGKAKIEFYNNSTCHHISVSAEGITKDDKAIVYE